MKHKRTIIKKLKAALVAHFGGDIRDIIRCGSQERGHLPREKLINRFRGPHDEIQSLEERS